VGGVSKLVIQPPSPWSFYSQTDNFNTLARYLFDLVERRPSTATSCLTGDDLLDQQVMRNGLDSLWKLAGGDSVVSLKKERGGVLYEDSTGVVGFSITPPDINGTACQTTNSATNIPDHSTFLASVHIHPFYDGQDTQVCHPGQAAGVSFYDGQHHYGISLKKVDSSNGIISGDVYGIENMTGIPGLVGMYIMDRDQISFGPVGTTNKNLVQKGNAKKRVQLSGCRIV
jgi:hypothetical protein